MGFDASRPVPWNLLLKRFGLMFGGLLVVTVLFSGGKQAGGLVTGLLLGGLLFFVASWLLSKFGYAPKSMAQIRQEAVTRNAERAADPGRAPRQSRRAARAGTAVAAAPSRPKPPPTKRTASGVGRHPQPRKR